MGQEVGTFIPLRLRHLRCSDCTTICGVATTRVYRDGVSIFLAQWGFPSNRLHAKMSTDKRRYRSKARPGLEYTVESFCFGYKDAVHGKPKKARQSVCYGVNFVKVTINKGEVSVGGMGRERDCNH